MNKAINIQPEYLNLDRLLYRRLFRIPEYQRAYSWTLHQRNDLFQDILRAVDKGQDSFHFMAAVVCLVRGNQRLGADTFQVLEVVDGQQRITTLVILLNAIRNVLDENQKLRTELGDLLVKESDDLLLLQTNHDTSHLFGNYLRQGTAPDPSTANTTADREILSAISECTSFVRVWLEGGRDIFDLAAFLKNNLYFLLHQIDDEKAVYTVFEVLNSRGLDVSWFDRLKSILMGLAFELEDVDQAVLIADLHNIWKEIYSVIGLRQGLSTQALRFAATLRMSSAPSRPLGEEDSVATLRDQGKTGKDIREIALWILDVTQACDRIAASERLDAVTRIAQARLVAVAINLRIDISDWEREKLLKHWENVSFRIYGMLKRDARTSVGDYVRLAWSIINRKLTSQHIHEGLRWIGHSYSIDSAVDALREENCYEGWESELRYLLTRYEEHLAQERGTPMAAEEWEKIWLRSPSESIEHVTPQSSGNELRHRLGNLVLLTPRMNSRLQDKTPEAKAEHYRSTGLIIARDLADQIDTAGWSDDSINDRTMKLLDWARDHWADPEA